jgi:predicted transglutaminase-like cysteine proteinase
MFKTILRATCVIASMLASGLLKAAATAQELAAASSMTVIGAARPPVGYIQFCKSFPRDCVVAAAAPEPVKLTRRSLRELDRVNRLLNTRIAPKTDQELYGTAERWTYPGEAGDCEDYVLAKRKLLMEAGFPRQALLITVVRDQKGDGHAVLTVVTDRGDLVLDNQRDDILPWDRTEYRYVKRQSERDPNAWVMVGETPSSIGVATAQ